MAGGMEVQNNRYVEEWAAARENLEKTFRFSRRNLGILITFGLITPLLVHQAIKKEYRMQDELAGRVPRKYF